MEQTTLQRAVASEPFNGNQSKFADAIGTSQQNISNWLRKGSDLPPALVPKAAEVTGIPKHEWNAVLWPPAEALEPAGAE